MSDGNYSDTGPEHNPMGDGPRDEFEFFELTPSGGMPRPLGVEPIRNEPWRKWLPAAVAAMMLVGIVGVTVLRSDDEKAGSGAEVKIEETAVPRSTVPLTRTLKVGSKGPDVRRLQLRLQELAFVPGPIDGEFGVLTEKALWAYQKLVLGTGRTEVISEMTPAMWDQMQMDITISPRRKIPNANHTEIYLPEQVMVVFWKDKPELITHISTGSGELWCEPVIIDPGEPGNDTLLPMEKGICGTSVTPPGVYFFYNRRLSMRNAALGTMFNPVYFNHGIAVHGAVLTPLEPASHGCVRIPMYTAEIFPAKVYYNDVVYVFDGIKEPEEYGQIDPPLNFDDPNYTTTTVTTTTTTTTTTTLPPTTTTTLPAPTTTKAPKPK